MLCLLPDVDKDDVDNTEYMLNEDTARRTAPFISSFPKIKTIYVGGLSSDEAVGNKYYTRKYCYGARQCSAPENHREIYRGLLNSIVGALDSGTLQQPDTDKVLISYGRDAGCTEDNCLCRDICRCFPLCQAINKYI